MDALHSVLIAARHKVFARDKKYKTLRCKLENIVAYFAIGANPDIPKLCQMALVRYHEIQPDEKTVTIVPEEFEAKINADKENGFEPFIFIAHAGNRANGNFDNFKDLGLICRRHKIWFHIEATFGGPICALPEYGHLLKGVEFADSISFDPFNGLGMAADGTILYLRNLKNYKQSFTTTAFYLTPVHRATQWNYAVDFRHYGIPLTRRPRGMKYWIAMRLKGLDNIRNHVRKVIRTKNHLVCLIKDDKRFEITFNSPYNLVCLRFT